MKKIIYLILILVATAIYAQKSGSIRVTHFPANTLVDGVSKFVAPNYIRVSTTNLNCFSFLDVDVFVKANNDQDNPYEYKVTVTNNSQYEVFVNCSTWGFGSGGASSLAPGESHSGEKYASVKNLSIRIYDVDIEFNSAIKSQYPFYYDYLGNIDCNDTPNSILSKMEARGRKEEKITTIKNEIKTLGRDRPDLERKLALLQDLKNIDTKRDYNSQIEEVRRQLKQLDDCINKKNEEISELKSSINTLGDSKEDLIQKKSLYEKLNTLDDENNYDNEISELENSIEAKNEENSIAESDKKQN